MAKRILEHIKSNNKYYDGTESVLINIVETIKKDFSDEVFSEVFYSNSADQYVAATKEVNVSESSPNTVQPNAQEPSQNSSKKRSSGYYYTFTYDGKLYENKKLKEVMLTVFENILMKHLDKTDLFLKELSCLGEGKQIDRHTQPGVFRAGKVIKVNGRQIAIGTSLNEISVFNYIDKLLQICKEPDIFKLEDKISKDSMKGDFLRKTFESTANLEK